MQACSSCLRDLDADFRFVSLASRTAGYLDGKHELLVDELAAGTSRLHLRAAIVPRLCRGFGTCAVSPIMTAHVDDTTDCDCVTAPAAHVDDD